MTPDVFEIDSVDFSHRNTKQRSSPQVLSVGSVRSLRWFSCRCVSRCVLTVFFFNERADVLLRDLWLFNAVFV